MFHIEFIIQQFSIVALIVGLPLHTMEDIFKTRCLRRANFIKDETHHLFSLLPQDLHHQTQAFIQ